MSDAPPVELRGLVKRYGEILAVAGVDLTVEPRRRVRVPRPERRRQDHVAADDARPVRPTEGSVRLFGRDPLVDGAKALDGVAGFVEGPRFYPYLSGRSRNLELLADYDDGDSRSRIDEVLELVELRDRAKDRVGTYSHGMGQRLGIAAALLRNPKLLLLDEPTTGLDPAGMRDMRDLVRRLAGEGLTVLLSSHLLGEVEALQPSRDHPHGPDRLRGLARRVARNSGERLSPEDDRDRTGPHGLPLATWDRKRPIRQRNLAFFEADEEAVARLSIALGQARIGVTALVPETASLEELFLGMTEGEQAPKEAVA